MIVATIFLFTIDFEKKVISLLLLKHKKL